MAGRRKDLGWFPMYATETLADDRFQGWTCEERGAWLTLVLTCWHVGSIPASPELLRRTLHMDAPTFRVVWEQIGNRFAQSDEDPERLVSPRLEKERAKANRIASVRAKAGAEGGKAKALRAHATSSNCQANAKQAPAVALAKPAPTPTPTPTPRSEEATAALPLRPLGVHIQGNHPVLCEAVAAASREGVGVEVGRQASAWGEAESLIGLAGGVAPVVAVWVEVAKRRSADTGRVPLAYLLPATRDLVKRGAAPRPANGRPDPAVMDYSKPPEF